MAAKGVSLKGQEQYPFKIEDFNKQEILSVPSLHLLEKKAAKGVSLKSSTLLKSKILTSYYPLISWKRNAQGILGRSFSTKRYA